MTSKLEKQFFDTFGIEPRKVKICRNVNHCPKKYKLCNDDCKHWQVIRTDYPEITDRILLELICIANKAYIDLEGTDIETMKNSLLENFVFFRRDVYDDIQKLFEEG